MIGNGGWSFSLNRSATGLNHWSIPTLVTQQSSVSYTISPLSTGPSVYGVFEGRHAVSGVARAMRMTVESLVRKGEMACHPLSGIRRRARRQATRSKARCNRAPRAKAAGRSPNTSRARSL
jgi:hypothetical protein